MESGKATAPNYFLKFIDSKISQRESMYHRYDIVRCKLNYVLFFLVFFCDVCDACTVQCEKASNMQMAHYIWEWSEEKIDWSVQNEAANGRITLEMMLYFICSKALCKWKFPQTVLVHAIRSQFVPMRKKRENDMLMYHLVYLLPMMLFDAYVALKVATTTHFNCKNIRQ